MWISAVYTHGMYFNMFLLFFLCRNITMYVKTFNVKLKRLLKIDEVWHFPNHTDGLFKDYVDTFLKIKQEVRY
jgi:hypothetical protein